MGALALVLAGCDQPAEAANRPGPNDESYYTVKFDAQGGEPKPKDFVVLKDPPSTADKPADPRKNGSFFQGWYTEAESLENEYTFTEIVKSNITLYAGWKEADGMYEVSNLAEWNDAVKNINGAGNGEDGKNKNYIIRVKADLKLPTSSDLTFTTQYLTVAIEGSVAGRKLEIAAGSLGSLLNIGLNQKITTEKLNLLGSSNNVAPLVKADGGAFELNADSKITGNTNTVQNGGAVWVKDGALGVNGGVISGNFANANNMMGAAAYVENSKVTLNKAELSGNTSKVNGSLFVSGGTLDITDGVISGNLGTSAVYIAGGCEASITGTRFEKNLTSCVFMHTGKLAVKKAAFAENTGICFNIQGGTALVLDVEECAFTLNKSNQVVYAGNNAEVTITKSTFTECGTYNVQINGTNAKFTMTDCEISKVFGNNYGIIIAGAGTTGTLKNVKVKDGQGTTHPVLLGDRVKVTLEDCEISGTNQYGIRLENGAQGTMRGGRIEGNSNGVLVCQSRILADSTGLTNIVDQTVFTMEDSEASSPVITDNNFTPANANRGVYITGRSKFVMKSGEISKHVTTGNNGGGVYMENFDSEFVMEGGSIIENTANNHGGVFVNGGARMTMTGGLIARNIARNGAGTGIGISGYNDISNYGPAPAGVTQRRYGEAVMSGGVIENNKSTSNGAGVYVGGNSGTYFATFTMRGSAKITGNEITVAGFGAGVYVDGAIFNFEGGTISGNKKAEEATGVVNGGGIYMTNGSAVVTMSGVDAKISGNSANDGGGVFVNQGSFRVINGTIQGSNVSREGLKNTVTGGAGTYAALKGTASLGSLNEAGVWTQKTSTANQQNTVFVRDGAIVAYDEATEDPEEAPPPPPPPPSGGDDGDGEN